MKTFLNLVLVLLGLTVTLAHGADPETKPIQRSPGVGPITRVEVPSAKEPLVRAPSVIESRQSREVERRTSAPQPPKATFNARDPNLERKMPSSQTEGGLRPPEPRMSRDQIQAKKDATTLRTFPEVGRASRGVADVLKMDARTRIEGSARSVDQSGRITREDAPRTGALASKNHDRGAVDFAAAGTARMAQDSLQLSKKLGPNHTVIHERPFRFDPKSGKKDVDQHDIYVDGRFIRSERHNPRATGEHFHAQPDYNTRLDAATRTSPTGPCTNTQLAGCFGR
jgi:hypothetical protein